MKKRFLSCLLILCMVFSLLPVSALATTDVEVTLGRTRLGQIERTLEMNTGISGYKDTTQQLAPESVTLPVGQQGSFQRLPTTIINNVQYSPKSYGVIQDRCVDVSDPEVVGNFQYSLEYYTGTDYPCLQFNYTAKQAGTATIKLEFFYNFGFDPNEVQNGNTWWRQTKTINVTVTDADVKPDKPTEEEIKSFQDELSGWTDEEHHKWAVVCLCKTNNEHGIAWTSLTDGKYSFGDVVANDGSYSTTDGTPITKKAYPWMCTMTVNTQDWVDEYNLNKDDVCNADTGAKYGEHKLADGEAATKTIHWFYSAESASWDWLEDAPLVIKVDCVPASTEIHYVLVQDFNYEGTGSTKWTQVADTATDPYTFNVLTGREGDPKRENFKFLGWADESTATTAQYQAGNPIELTRENPTKTIYAVWTPCGHDNYEWVDNGDGTHSEECTECGHKKDDKEAHADENNDGTCDKCGADMPTPPIDPPTKPDEGSDLIAGLKVRVECTTPNSGHAAKEYAVTSFTDCVIGEPTKLTDTTYTCTVTLPRAAAVAKYNDEIGTEHTDALANANVTWTLSYSEGEWTLTSENPVTIEVTCNGSQPETPPTKPESLDGGVTFECENPDKTHTVFYSTTYTIQAKDYTFISDVQYDNETKQYYVLANVTLDSEYYLELFDGWTGAKHRISDGQSLKLTGIRFNYKKSDAPGGVASWTQELPKPVIKVTCAAELVPFELVIYRNGDTSTAYKTVRVAMVPKGTEIKAADYPIGNYYDGTNSGGKYDFYGWYDDGLWNIYKRDPANPPAGLTEKTVNGWTNFKCMVYDYEKVVYFQTKEALTDYQNDHSKTAGLLYTTTARKGDALPTADAPAATREGYTFLYWSREGQTSDVTGQTVNGWTNLYANWEKIPEPTKDNIEFNGKNKVYVKCDIYGTHAELIAYDQGEYEIVPTSDTTANLVFKSATYLAASKYANDHALASASDPEVSTQIVFEDGKWQQLKNGPTVQVRCKVTLTYDANAPEGVTVRNMPDPLKVTQTLDAGGTTTFNLSENIPERDGYVFIGWTSDKTQPVPTIPVEWKTENNGANWKTTTGYPGYTLYAVWQKITTPDVSEIDFSGKQIYVKCAIYGGAHGEFIDYIPGSYRIDWDGVSPKANLVFTAQSYLDASTFAGDHVLTNAAQTEVSTQIVFENGQWTQKINGPTVWVSCQATLTYDGNKPANASESAAVEDVPDAVKQTLTDKETKTTVIALSNETPSLKGYKFLGWAKTADAATPDYPVGDMTDAAKWSITVGYEGKTLYAVWARTYSIYYDGNGGTFTKGGKDFTHVSDNDLTLGEPHTLRENVFTREHYEFTGWATEDGSQKFAGGETVTFPESTKLNGKGQIKLYAQWKPVEYTVTFDADGGAPTPDTQTVEYNKCATKPKDPTKDGYKFLGWFEDGATEAFKFDTKITKETKLTAKWEKLYKIVYHGANGATVESDWLEYDTEYTLRANSFTDLPHTFLGWATAANSDTVAYTDGQKVKFTKTDAVNDEVHLYAVWTHTLTIKYLNKKNDEELDRYEVELANGKSIDVTYPTIKGYRLYERETHHVYTMGDSDVTYIVYYVKRSTGNGGGTYDSPNKTKKTSPALTLNTADHFAFINGYPDGTVKPNGNVTRAEVAAILYRVMDADCVKTYETTRCSFSDVVRGDWFNLYVATLENAGVIVDTRTNGKFRPNEAITRAELAAMLAQFADIKSAANSFNDVSARHWASDEIAVCAKMGWINGYPDGSFRPDATITRAEMMAMINRALDRTPKSVSDLLSGMKTWSDNANTGAWYYLDVQEATNSHTYTKSGTHETWKKLR